MSFFRFCQFDVYQDRCAHRVGTDAMLLGSWARTESVTTALDIGSGTGVLALMLAQRAPQALIEGLEIDQDSLLQARENIAASPWPGRIQLQACALQSWQPPHAYDLLICNPPYFDETTRSGRLPRDQARHTDTLTLAELLQHSLRLLRPNGKLALVLPVSHETRLQQLAGSQGLYLQRRCQVRHSLAHPVKRLLLELGQRPVSPEYQELPIRDPDGEYSQAYQELTRPYHTLRPPLEYRRHARPADFQRQR